jgi:CHASE2 domain-containing sensor protein
MNRGPTRTRKLYALIAFACVLLIAALILLPRDIPWILPAEHWTADWRTVLLSDRLTQPPEHPKLAVVLVNDDVLREYGISDMHHARGLLSKIIAAVDAAHPSAIGLDFFFLSEPDADTTNTQTLITTIKNATSPVIVGVAEPPIEMNSNERDYQSSFIGQTNRKAGFVNVRYETGDKVVRFYPGPSTENHESLDSLLAEAGGSKPKDAAGQRIPWLLPPRNGLSALLPQRDDDKKAFLTIPAQHLLPPPGAKDQSSPASTDLKDRIVLIGADLPRSDKHYTPFSVWTSQKMPGVLIHAHMTAGLLDQPARAITELDRHTLRYLLFGIALVGVGVGWYYWQSLLLGFVSWTLGLVALIVLDAVMFAAGHVTLPMMQAVVVWFLAVTTGHSIHSVGAKPVEAGK